MMRGTLLLAAIAALGVATSHASAAGIQVTSSDANARFMALGVSKSVVIDLPTDLKNVFVADPGIVAFVVGSKRRVFLVGKALGQTNVYFFGTDGRMITGLDVAVTSSSQQGALENYPFPANVVQVFNGSKGQTLSCTPLACIDAAKPGSDQPPGTQNINVTGSASSVSVGGK